MWQVGDVQLTSRFLLGTANYPSPQVLADSIGVAEAEIITVSLRRQMQGGAHNTFWSQLQQLDCHILPNTAGCFSAQEAIATAQMARELFDTDWIKLEVIGDEVTLQPDPFGLLEAAEVLVKEGFTVWPYCTSDLILCQRLADIGCTILMPWGAMIGSGQGLAHQAQLALLRERFPDHTLIVDAGIGAPSHAAQAMELGFDAVLLNTAVAEAHDPVAMAGAFKQAIEAGHHAYHAGLMPQRDIAKASSPWAQQAFREGV